MIYYMNFVSLNFFLIVLGTITLYYIFPSKYRWYVLLASSCAFYVVAAGWWALLAALVTVLVSYFSAVWIERSRNGKKKQRLILAVSLVILIGFLILTKIKKLVFTDLTWLIVPLGISYYTFSIIGYLVDVYTRKQDAETNYLKLLLYTLFFPKIMQGPIVKIKDFGPKLLKGQSADYQNICYGLQRIVWGYFKKLVIVERVAMLRGNIFDYNISDYSSGGAVLLFTTFVCTVSHYCDFSGYMDIVIGISQIIGIEMDENFRQPFFSKTAAEFWRRWHITLGIWFKDYVYMPIVINPRVIRVGKWVREHIGKRAGNAVLTIIPLTVVWILTGLWHGTGIDYVVWGFYWGLIIILANVFAPEIKKLNTFLHINPETKVWKCFQILRTFGIFTCGLLISTFVGISQLKSYFWYVLKDFGADRFTFETFEANGIDRTNLILLIVAIAILYAVDIMALFRPVRGSISGLAGVLRWTLYALLVLFVIFLGVYGPGYSTNGFAYAFF